MSRPITSLRGFIGKVARTMLGASHSVFLFRGHSKTSYIFLPSIFRTENYKKSEHLMLRQILAEHPDEFVNDSFTFDKLVRAQHYGLPTRLLDVSTNPLVALYFACCSSPSDNGKVIIAKPNIQGQKYFDSDAVSLMSNLALLNRSEKEALLSAAKKGPSQPPKDRIAAFCADPTVDKLIQAVRQEKPYFRAEADPFDMAYVTSVVPRKTHGRIKAQSGAFLLFGMVESETGVHLDHITLEEVEIKSTSKSQIMKDLSLMGISTDKLFPEIENSARQIASRYS